MVRSEAAKTLLDEKKLVELILSWEERIAINELSHDTSNRPDINWAVVRGSDQQFWRSVPTGSNVVGIVFALPFEGPREPEITNFKFLVF